MRHLYMVYFIVNDKMYKFTSGVWHLEIGKGIESGSQ